MPAIRTTVMLSRNMFVKSWKAVSPRIGKTHASPASAATMNGGRSSRLRVAIKVAMTSAIMAAA